MKTLLITLALLAGPTAFAAPASRLHCTLRTLDTRPPFDGAIDEKGKFRAEAHPDMPLAYVRLETKEVIGAATAYTTDHGQQRMTLQLFQKCADYLSCPRVVAEQVYDNITSPGFFYVYYKRPADGKRFQLLCGPQF